MILYINISKIKNFKFLSKLCRNIADNLRAVKYEKRIYEILFDVMHVMDIKFIASYYQINCYAK